MIRLDLSKCQGFVHHRSGWNFCISQLKCLHSKSGILVDDFIERSFSWQVDSYYNGNNKYNLPHQREWIGFMHNPPNAPSWFDGYHSPQAILDREVFQESLKYCKCLITLSDYLKEWLQIRVNVPVISVKHPTEIPNQKWCAEAFSSQRPRPIVQLGYWLRKFHSIYKLKCGPLYKRMWLPSNYEYALCLQELFNKSNKQFKEKQFEFHGVEVCKFKPNKDAPFFLGWAKAISLADMTGFLLKEAIATEALSIILLITISTASLFILALSDAISAIFQAN